MHLCRLAAILTVFCALGSCQVGGGAYDGEEIIPDAAKHDDEFFTFITRPDIDAPRWNITVYDKDAVAPGLYFLAPYGIVEQVRNDSAYVGPHIYDNSGELIWGGAKMFNQFDTFAFQVSRVNGEDVLTLIYPETHTGHFIDHTYSELATLQAGRVGLGTNMHEFQIVDNGTKAAFLVDFDSYTKGNAELLGVTEADRFCFINYQGIEERDIKTSEITWSWDADAIVPFESVMFENSTDELCYRDDHRQGDYMHLNSIEKISNNAYLVSGRRTNAIYKVKINGEIEWRLGGKYNDFAVAGDLHWSGQHDVRCLFENATHLTLSFLDNAIVHGAYPETSTPWSRGLVVSVNTAEKTAELIKEYRHPYVKYADERGNFQTLPNGNVLISWTHDALNSEHKPNGDLVRVAFFPSGLKTYRGFKFEWVGKPIDPPDVHAQVLTLNQQRTTTVHVSWNGATEVAAWNLYETDAEGLRRNALICAPRNGFETVLLYDGQVDYILVQAVDRAGKPLGESAVVKAFTNPSPLRNETDLTTLPQRTEELSYLHAHGNPFKLGACDILSPSPDVDVIEAGKILSFLNGILLTAAAGALAWYSRRLVARWRKRRRGEVYVQLPMVEGEEEFVRKDRVALDDLPSLGALDEGGGGARKGK